MNEETLIQLVPDIDNDIVVCRYVNGRTWKFAIYGDDLQYCKCSETHKVQIRKSKHI